MEIEIKDEQHIMWSDEDICTVVAHRGENNLCSVTLKYSRSRSNCKLATIDHVTRLMSMTPENKIKVINFIMKFHPQVQLLSISVSKRPIVEFIEENFDVVSRIDIPIGYSHSEGYQYHMMIRNTIANQDWQFAQDEYSENLKDKGIQFHSKYLKQ